MCEIGVDIIKTEETEESGIKYLNINVSSKEVEKNPDIVRLCSDIGILEYVKHGTEGNMISKNQLNHIRDYIVNNIMRDPDIMFNDECRDKVDLPAVIASLYECLHIAIMGEPYNYMFHWANKCGSWVEDDLFINSRKK